MSVTEGQRKIIDTFTEKTVKRTRVSEENWTRDGEQAPWLFDDTVFELAYRAKLSMSFVESNAFFDLALSSDSPEFWQTHTALKSRDLISGDVMAALIVEMYHQVFG